MGILQQAGQLRQGGESLSRGWGGMRHVAWMDVPRALLVSLPATACYAPDAAGSPQPYWTAAVLVRQLLPVIGWAVAATPWLGSAPPAPRTALSPPPPRPGPPPADAAMLVVPLPARSHEKAWKSTTAGLDGMASRRRYMRSSARRSELLT